MDFCQVHGELSREIFVYRVHTPFGAASARRALCVRSCNRLLCLENQTVIGYVHRTVGFLFCPRRAAMQELRAKGNWRRVVKRLKRIHRLRKIWACLGPHLKNYTPLN